MVLRGLKLHIRATTSTKPTISLLIFSHPTPLTTMMMTSLGISSRIGEQGIAPNWEASEVWEDSVLCSITTIFSKTVSEVRLIRWVRAEWGVFLEGVRCRRAQSQKQCTYVLMQQRQDGGVEEDDNNKPGREQNSDWGGDRQRQEGGVEVYTGPQPTPASGQAHHHILIKLQGLFGLFFHSRDIYINCSASLSLRIND